MGTIETRERAAKKEGRGQSVRNSFPPLADRTGETKGGLPAAEGFTRQ